MGCSIYAHAIVGLRVPWGTVYKGQKRVKAFDHNHPEDWDVDPKTGEKLWRLEDEFVDGFKPYDPFYGTSAELCGYEVVYRRPSEHVDFAFVCLAQVKSKDLTEGWHMNLGSIPSARNRKEFKDKMIELGLWDDDNCGLWLFGYGIA
jgi:hypothetical protein